MILSPDEQHEPNVGSRRQDRPEALSVMGSEVFRRQKQTFLFPSPVRQKPVNHRARVEPREVNIREDALEAVRWAAAKGVRDKFAISGH